MKGKAIASALTVLTLFAATPAVSARHLAEEYADRVQRERQERLQEEAHAARMRRQSESRRRVAEEQRERRRSEEEQRYATESVLDDDEDFDEDEEDLVVREEVSVEREAARGEEGAEKERAETEAQSADAEAAREAAEKAAEEDASRKEESRPPEANVQMARVKEENVGEATDTGEGILAKYMRIARERLEGKLPIQTASQAPGLHIAEPQEVKLLAVETVDSDGILLFSDSPEYVKEPGVLYSDIVKDDARVFYYHLNDTKKPHKVAVVLEGESERSAVVSITRRAIAAPSENYCEVGKSLQQAYFADAREPEKIVVAPHERRLLLEAADKTTLRPGELISGMADFSASAPVRVSILFYPPDENPLRYISEAKILPADEHRLRGTFIGMNRTVRLKSPYHPKKDGISCVVLADGEIDPYREGVDATDGSIVTNCGNYGVVYRLEMPVMRKTRFLMSPMGGGYAGFVRVDAGKDGTRLIAVPEGRLLFGENSAHPPFDVSGVSKLLPSVELADLGVWKKKPQPFFEFSPPGASNLPVMLILAPEKVKLAGEKEKES